MLLGLSKGFSAKSSLQFSNNIWRNTMKLPRRAFLQLAGAAAVAPAFSPVATAQTYPNRPISMIVAFPAGGPNDAVGRVVAERMRASLGQAVIIENVSGANGSIGTGRVARAKPDGYTIQEATISTHMLNGAVYSLPYDVLNDFAAVSPWGHLRGMLFGRKALPCKDLNELIAWLKANPNKASAGITTTSVHLLTAFFQKESGTQLTFVPYRGAAPAMQDLVAGQIDLLFQAPDLLPLVRAGSLKAYAVAGDTRSSLAPDVPTFAEMGLPALSFSLWYGLVAPRGTPKEIIDRLNAATVEALADPAVRSRLADLGMEIFPRERQTPDALAALQKADIEKWWPLIKEFGIKAE
jgi:tripartite-type tricarboxylate transporter receptor subunit TctC